MEPSHLRTVRPDSTPGLDVRRRSLQPIRRRPGIAVLDCLCQGPLIAGPDYVEPIVKPRPPRQRRSPPPRDFLPPDVPEVATTATPTENDTSDSVPEHIRRMLEAAYT